MKLTCPHCNTAVPLEALSEDSNARELFALLARLGPAAGPMNAYLGLFKPRLQALRWSRALALACEVRDRAHAADIALESLAAALVETAEALREKRQAPGWMPLTNHNYLWRVLESAAVRPGPAPAAPGASAPGRSRTAQVVAELRGLPAPPDVPEWFARALYEGLAHLVVSGVDGIPAYDMLPEVANQWAVDLWPRREWRETCRFRGRQRIGDAFRSLADGRRWPTQADVLGMIPRV